MNFNLIFKDIEELNQEYPAALKPVFFESNGKEVIGSMYIAQGEGPHPTINLLHGFPGYEQNTDLAQVLRRVGFNVLIFHYRGAWGSEGNYSFNNVLQDVQASIEFLKSEKVAKDLRIDTKKICLIGHSMGGFAALLTAAKNSEINTVVSIAGFNLGAFASGIKDKIKNINSSINAWEENIPPLEGTSARELINESMLNIQEYNLINYAEELSKRSLLLIASSKDYDAPIQVHHHPLIEALNEKCAKDITGIIFDDDHAFSRNRIELAKVIVSWLEKHQ